MSDRSQDNNNDNLNRDENTDTSQPAQFPDVDVYKFIQTWWGEELSINLIELVKAAPIDHCITFLGDWNQASDALEENFKHDLVLPQLDAGRLRPLVHKPGTSSISLALTLSLYCHEVIIANPLAGLTPHNDADEETREAIVNALHQLLTVQPLVQSGVFHLRTIPTSYKMLDIMEWIFFTVPDETTKIIVDLGPTEYTKTDASGDSSTYRIGGHFGGDSPSIVMSNGDVNTGAWMKISFEEFQTYHALAESLLVYSKTSGKGQLMLSERTQSRILRNALRRIGYTNYDLRDVAISKLTALPVPLLYGKVSDLIAIRKSDEVFANWREALAVALTQVGDVPGEAEREWQQQASAVVHAELEPFRRVFQDAAETSPALKAMQGGVASLGIEAIGAGVGAAMGGGWGSTFTGLVAGKAADTLINYLKALRARRSARAVLDIALVFDPQQREP